MQDQGDPTLVFADLQRIFALTLTQARSVIRDVARVTAAWRDTAQGVGVRPADIGRIASAFEHDDLKRALAL